LTAAFLRYITASNHGKCTAADNENVYLRFSCVFVQKGTAPSQQNNVAVLQWCFLSTLYNNWQRDGQVESTDILHFICPSHKKKAQLG
jgi:hypothetical protein